MGLRNGDPACQVAQFPATGDLYAPTGGVFGSNSCGAAFCVASGLLKEAIRGATPLVGGGGGRGRGARCGRDSLRNTLQYAARLPRRAPQGLMRKRPAGPPVMGASCARQHKRRPAPQIERAIPGAETGPPRGAPGQGLPDVAWLSSRPPAPWMLSQGRRRPMDAEPTPTSTQELRELALSHPRWAAATARVRAADGAIAEALSAQEGFVGIARRVRATETPRSKKRGKAERAYLRARRETSTTPWPSDPDVFAPAHAGLRGLLLNEGRGALHDRHLRGRHPSTRKGKRRAPGTLARTRHEAAHLGANFSQTVRFASVTLVQRRGLALHIGGSEGP